MKFIVFMWSAVTCYRFLKHRLVDVSGCGFDKSSPNKAVTSHRTPHLNFWKLFKLRGGRIAKT